MKKYTILSIILFISFFGNAQFHFTIQGGIIHTTNHIKQGLIGVGGYENYSSFDFGIAIIKRLSKKINLETGLFYTQKGYGFHSGANPYSKSSGYNHVNYISLNQNFIYKFFNFKKIVLFGGAGAFIAKGLSGDFIENDSSLYIQNHFKGKIKFGNSSDDEFKSLDGGLNFLLRLGFKKFNITTIFSPSLINHIPKGSQQSIKEKLQSFSFNLGYTF